MDFGLLGTVMSTRTAKGKKQKVYILSKTTTLHGHHALLYIFLPSLRDYDVKIPDFTFCGERELKTTLLCFFSWIQYSLKIQLQKQWPTWWTERWSKRDKGWSSATRLLLVAVAFVVGNSRSTQCRSVCQYTHNSGKLICSLVLYIRAWKTLFEANRPSFRAYCLVIKCQSYPKRRLQCSKFGHA